MIRNILIIFQVLFMLVVFLSKAKFWFKGSIKFLSNNAKLPLALSIGETVNSLMLFKVCNSFYYWSTFLYYLPDALLGTIFVFSMSLLNFILSSCKGRLIKPYLLHHVSVQSLRPSMMFALAFFVWNAIFYLFKDLNE